MEPIYVINGNLYLAHFPIKLLQLNSISVTQFKNYSYRSFHFNSRIVGISGPNGVGKTNLLDAIYYLCFTKSYFNRSDAMNASNGCMGFRIDGSLQRDERVHHVVCILRETGRKEFLLDDECYDKFARHVGRFPCVFIAPDDVKVIVEGSEERRRYIDALLSQLDSEYLQRLIHYNKLLQQRNSFLRSLAENRMQDTGLLDVYDAQLVEDGNYLFQKRQQHLGECIAQVCQFYRKISGNEEPLSLAYESQLQHQPFATLLARARDKDRLLQRTTAGIHKDDLEISLAGQPFRNIASQGQRKSLLFALKLAEFNLLKQNKGFAPLLLLDDVFEKLDSSRMHNLLEWVCVQNAGQIFITDTHAERIHLHLQQLNVPYQLIEL